jgi:hypothetical protein
MVSLFCYGTHVHSRLHEPNQKVQELDASFIAFDKPPKTKYKLALKHFVVNRHKASFGREQRLEQFSVAFFQTESTPQPLQMPT